MFLLNICLAKLVIYGENWSPSPANVRKFVENIVWIRGRFMLFVDSAYYITCEGLMMNVDTQLNMYAEKGPKASMK